MPSAFPSALSAQHFVTAGQYNNMLSGLITIPIPYSAIVSNTITPVSGRYEALMMTRPSGRHNYMMMMYIGPSYTLGSDPGSSMAYTLINFNPNLISYKYPSASGTWAAGPFSATAAVDGDTGNPAGGQRSLSAQSTATITGVTYIQWDLGAIVTGALYWNIEIQTQLNVAGWKTSAAIRVSNDATTYSTVTSYTASSRTVTFATAGISAGVPMRYVQVTQNAYGVAGATSELWVGEIAVFTSSAFYNVASGQPTWETITANITGNLITLYTTAPTPISLQIFTAPPAWRLQA